MKLILEPRCLFDGSVVAVASHAGGHEHADHHHHGETRSATAPAADAAAPSTAKEIVFVDPRVADWQQLVANVGSDVRVVVLNPNRDALQQITRVLDHSNGVTAIDILSYGTEGQIQAGSTPITATTVEANSTEVASWASHLAPNAAIQIYGCDVGAGADGQALITDLHTLTGAQVAASTDATGSAALGGNWTLEATTGPITIHDPFGTAAESAYTGVLDVPIPTVTLSSVPTDVPLGSTFSETVTFQNTASAAAGYGPFIELFVPSATGVTGTEVATLTSATYLGASVTTQTITLSSTIAGHLGTVGAIDPLVLDSSGNATFVAAPAGFQAGDTMYVLSLPFGSFTVGQPAASVVLNFTLDSRSTLGTAALDIAAIGGFQYGADPLNDPSTDPSIRGTAATPTVTTSGDGLASAISNVTLLSVTTVAYTWPGEGETATGPSFPGSYLVTLTPAPVTGSDAITDLAFTITLPNDVQYTGGTITVSGGGTVSASSTATDATPGGTVVVDFTSMSSAQTISIPFYVPETDTGGAQILSDASGTDGNPTTIALSPVYTYTADNWTNTTSGAFSTTAVAVGGSGQVGDASFTAKSLAVQVTDAEYTDTGASGFTPGDVIAYTIHFQVSDYFDLNNLVLTDLLSDGMTLMPGMAPVLNIVESGAATNNISFTAITDAGTTVNGQAVSTSGSNTNWTYTRDNTTTGETTLTFNVGQLLSTTSGILSSTLTGSTAGTYGTVTFYATVLDKYTLTEGPSGSLNATTQSLREGDSTYDSVSGSGTVTSHVSLVSQTQTDTSSVSNTEVKGDLNLTIVDVNGSSPGSTVTITPGDLITYQLTYDLTTGDYGDLNLTGYVPLPVFVVPSGGMTEGADLATTLANSGDYWVVTNSAGGTTSPTVTVNTTANSVNFNFGTNDATTNPAGTKVVVDFTLVAASTPFADGLLLTTEAQSHYTNLDTPTISTAVTAIKQQVLDEPSLTIKTGIVSDIGDSGTSSKSGVSYTVDGTSTSGDPTTIFDVAGTATGTSTAVFSGSIPTTIGNAENLNLVGADALDVVRIAETVQNTGHGSAYDVVVDGTLPTGYTVGNVSNFQITRGDGTVLTYSGTLAQFFSGTGITINGAGGTTATAALFSAGDASHRDILTITYDLTLASTQVPGATLTAAGAVLGFANGDGHTNFVNSGNAVGESASNLADTATITTTSPTLAKDVTAGNDTTNVSLYSVVAGETITYTVTLTLPEGEMTGASGDITLVDTLAAGTSYIASSESTIAGTNVVISGGSPSVVYSSGSRVLTIDLGSQILNSNADASGTVTFTYQAQILGSYSTGHTFTNAAQLNWSGTALTASKTVTQEDPAVTATLTANTSTLVSGETVTYTLTLQDATVPAEDLVDTITLPTGLTWVASSLTQTGGSGAVLDDTNHTITISQLGVGAGNKETFTFQATVNNNLAAGTALNVSTSTPYSSMPGTVANEKSFTATAAKSLSIGTFGTPSLTIVGESNGTDGLGTTFLTNPQTAVNVVVGDIVQYQAYVQVPEGSNSNVVLDVSLPAGMTYLGGAVVALASPNGDLSSSTIDPSGNTAGLQITEGGTAITPGTTAPTVAFTSGDIDTSTSGHVKFNLGTVSNNDDSAVANYVVVEFEAVVANVSANVDATTIAASLTAGGKTSSNATVTVKEPQVTIAKTVTGIDESTGTVSWKVVVGNTGDATAYGVTLTDAEPGSGANEGNIANMAETGNATSLVFTSGDSNGDGATTLGATMTLAAGKSETFTYTTTVVSTAAPVPDATATVTAGSLNGGTQTLGSGNTLVSTGAVGTATGERDGAGGVNTYHASATIGLGTVSGTVWNDVGSALNAATGVYGTGVETNLSGIGLTATWTGGSASALPVTDASGDFALLLPDNATVTIAAPATSGSGANLETLVYDTNHTSFTHTEAGVTGAAASVTVSASAGASVSGVDFVYRLPDTAPVLSNWGSTSATSPVNYTMGGSAVTLGTGGSSVVDTQLDALVTAGKGDYAGTVLTVARDGGASADDTFGGGGNSTTGLYFNGTAVSYNGTQIGTFTMSAGGTLTVTFGTTTTAATVKEVLDNLTYSNSGSISQSASGLMIDATLSDHNTQTGTANGNPFQGTGGSKTSAVVQVLLDIAPAAGSVVTYIEQNNSTGNATTDAAVPPTVAVALSPTFTFANPSATYSQVTLTITTGYVSGQDVLALAPAGGTDIGDITAAAFNAANGTLVLSAGSGSHTVAEWTAALQSVKYYDTSDTPNTGQRTITISSNSTGTETIPGTFAVATVTSTDDSPVLADTSGNPQSIAFSTLDGAPTAGVTPADAVRVSALISSGGVADALVTDPDGTGAGTQSPGIAITAVDTSKGVWWYSTNSGGNWSQIPSGSLSASTALLLDSSAYVYFQPASATTTGTVAPALTFRAWDESSMTGGGATAASFNGQVKSISTSGWGTGNGTLASSFSSHADTVTLTIEMPPQVVTDTGSNGDGTATVFIEPNNPPPAQTTAQSVAAAVVVDSGITVADNDPTVATPTFSKVTVQISGNYQAAEDVLAFTDTSDIHGSYASGVLTLTAAGGTPPTLAEWQAALRSVTYYDTSDTPVAATRTVSFVAYDTSGVATVQPVAGTRTVSVDPVDDSPVLDTSVAVRLQSETVDSNPPSGAVGTLVSSLIGGSLNVRDADGNGTGIATVGLAITGADTSHGSWWYSTDNGATWTEFAAAGTSTLGASHALLLVANSTTRVFFQSQGGWTGTLTEALAFRAWDASIQTNVTAVTQAGTVVTTDAGTDAAGLYTDLTVTGTLGSGRNVPLASFSADRDIVPLTVNALPVVTPPPVLSDPTPTPTPTPPPPPPPPPPVVVQAPTPEQTPTPGLSISNPDSFGAGAANSAGSLLGGDNHPEGLQLMLVGSVGNRFVIPNQPETIEIPPNIFHSTDMTAKLTYEARRPDGSPLPAWLKFDARNLTFHGTAPDQARGAVDIVIVAKDSHNNKAEAQFKILVGRDAGKDAPVQNGLKANHGGKPAATEQHGPAAGRHAGLSASPFFASLTESVAPAGRPSFQAEIQQAARAGKVAAAQAFIEAFRRPAA